MRLHATAVCGCGVILVWWARGPQAGTGWHIDREAIAVVLPRPVSVEVGERPAGHPPAGARAELEHQPAARRTPAA